MLPPFVDRGAGQVQVQMLRLALVRHPIDLVSAGASPVGPAVWR
ncbi:MAG TPA: hypothetical protein VFD01_12355 [Candidatus Dormibacteraeota bacterium]|jgi:hypothetical protein|nr:hypothetical protein [Candidatus Dormibacteraeota bacterium]